jgi:hypothetical protein
MSGIFSLSDMRKQGVHVCLKPIYIIMLCHKQMLVVSYRDVYPPKEGQTIQWPKEEGQTIQWSKEGQTMQWPKEGQTIQWPKEEGQTIQ